ncbi:MAG TPA: leucine-rich repeat protein [Candidatus Limihabitans stercoravium]|nr:leucine-rich repeat protein [Candidatus Limihabitans stercoravium]
MKKVKFVVLFMLVLIAALAMSACAPKVETVTVTFDLQGGTMDSPATVEVVKGDSVQLPIPTKDGYTFNGWFDDNQVKVTDEYKFTQDTVIVAGWSEFSSDALEFVLDEELGGYVCNGIRDSSVYSHIAIPESYQGQPVVSISDFAFYQDEQLKNITIPKSVIFIGDVAFLECKNLDSITVDPANTVYSSNGNCLVEISTKTLIQGTNNTVIPDDGSVTKVLGDAFTKLSGLKSITIPSTVTELGYRAFWECENLTEVNILANIKYIDFATFYRCEKLSSISLPEGLEIIGGDVFYGCSSLADVVIPSSVTTIGDRAFYDCSNLTEIDLPNELEEINDSAFAGSGITSIHIPYKAKLEEGALQSMGKLKTLTFASDYQCVSFGRGAISFCIQLESIKIPDSVENLGEYAFQSCSALLSVQFGEDSKLKTIGQYAFNYCINLKSVAIPEGISYLPRGIFENCSQLTAVNLPDSLTKIDYYAFSFCTSLTEIVIPDSVTEIEGAAFVNCYNLKSVVLPAGVRKISAALFSACFGLESVTIGHNIDLILGSAFESCESLKSIVIPTSVAYVESYVFQDCHNLTIYCEAASKPEMWWESWNISNCPVVWGHNNVTSNSQFDYVVHDDKAYITNWKEEGNVIEIPSSVDGYVVAGFGGIFANTDVSEIVIPVGVTSIGSYAFNNCQNLSKITFEEESQLRFIGEYAFSNCLSLTSIDIPSNVITIEEFAFDWCRNLNRVFIPASVKNIGESAFNHGNNLTIYCEVAKKPDTWDDNWTHVYSVVWGYKGE